MEGGDKGRWRPNRLIPSNRMNVSYRKTALAATILALAMVLNSCFLPVRPFDEKKWRAQVESADPALLYAPHLRDGRYFNPWMPMQKGFMIFCAGSFPKSPLSPGRRKTTFPTVVLGPA